MLLPNGCINKIFNDINALIRHKHKFTKYGKFGKFCLLARVIQCLNLLDVLTWNGKTEGLCKIIFKLA